MFSSKPGAETAPGARHARPANGQIAPRLIIRGDALSCFTLLQKRFRTEVNAPPQFEAARANPVSLVIGREASRITSRRGLSILLREVTNECVALSAKLPTLHHAIVVLAHPVLDARVALAACERAATRLHEQVAREHGDYLVATFLLLTDCDDPDLLARRILDRAAQPQATDSACALSWSDIKTVSIEFAAMNQYV